MEHRQYLLKIKLIGIEPEIWRSFSVPGSITLDRLHDVIQIVMGWTASHLHHFVINKKRYVQSPEDDQEYFEEDYLLADLIKQKGRKFIYIYDFGDNWEHQITVEDNNFNIPPNDLPIACLDGARACPPEDVGGVPGYERFCDAMQNPKDEDEDYIEWYGGIFDSEDFDLEKVNLELLEYMK